MSDVKDSHTDESQTRARIFREAASLFAEKGYHGVSMREISERAGVTKPTIYYYFGSKEGIYKALIDLGLEHGFEKINHIIQLDIPVKTKLVKLIQHRFKLSLQHPEIVKFFLRIMAFSENLPFLEDYKVKAERHRQILINVIQEGVDSGEFGAGAKPALAVEIIGGVLEHFIGMQLNSRKKILSDQLAEDIIELLFKGLNE